MNGPTRILARAKINLSLRVLGRRADGFHEIESLMVPLDLADEIEIRSGSEGISFRCSDPTLPVGEENLVVKAARAFCRRADPDLALELLLKKRIPHGAGLGGGSSDAAATLLALNRLSGNSLREGDLMELAAGIGSDVPFFLGGCAAVARGRGEQIEPVPFPRRIRLLLVKPEFGVPTPWAYGAWKDSREIDGFSYTPQPMPWGVLQNDLERPVFEKFLVLGDMKNWLLRREEVEGALMTGSGATLFAVIREDADLTAPIENLRAEFGRDLWVWETWAGGL